MKRPICYPEISMLIVQAHYTKYRRIKHIIPLVIITKVHQCVIEKGEDAKNEFFNSFFSKF